MQSYQRLMPGTHFRAVKILTYVAIYNSIFPDKKICSCKIPEFNKNAMGTWSASYGVSYKTRISQTINKNRGGAIQYGNAYLGQPINLNYLGRSQGMPGGSGKPPTNTF